jgi:hypothetical protein
MSDPAAIRMKGGLMAVKLRIGALDAGIVLRADGTLEAMIPRFRLDRMPPNVAVAGALFWACAHPAMLEQIMAAMESESAGAPPH